jgi:hypothetical protein
MKKHGENATALPLHPPKISYEVAHPGLNTMFNRKNSASNCLNHLHTKEFIFLAPQDLQLTVKMKGNDIFQMDAIWFYIQQKAALTKRAYFSKIYVLQRIISGFYVMWLLHLTSFCIHHIVVTDCRKNQELSGLLWHNTPNFVTINQLVQKTKRVLCDAYSLSLTMKNVLNLHVHPL